MPTIWGSNLSDNIYGTNLNVTINAWDSSNLPGNEGSANDNDYVFGGTGVETINGGNGNDWLNGGEGNDIVNGGAGHDLITINSSYDIDQAYGGSGTDSLHFNSSLDGIGSVFSIDAPDILQILTNGSKISGFEQLDFNGYTGDDKVVIS
jgi:Ca2+-binding RTX toxin-like protein